MIPPPSPFKEAISPPQPERVSTIAQFIRLVAEAIFSSPIGVVGVSEDRLYGLYIEVEVLGPTRKSLQEWLVLIDKLKEMKVNIPVYPEISGELDTAPGELGHLLGRGLAKMGVFLRLEKPIDITELISKERDR